METDNTLQLPQKYTFPKKEKPSNKRTQLRQTIRLRYQSGALVLYGIILGPLCTLLAVNGILSLAKAKHPGYPGWAAFFGILAGVLALRFVIWYARLPLQPTPDERYLVLHEEHLELKGVQGYYCDELKNIRFTFYRYFFAVEFLPQYGGIPAKKKDERGTGAEDGEDSGFPASKHILDNARAYLAVSDADVFSHQSKYDFMQYVKSRYPNNVSDRTTFRPGKSLVLSFVVTALITLVLAVFGIAVTSIGDPGQAMGRNDTVSFADPVVEAAVRSHLGRSRRRIKTRDLDSFTDIYIVPGNASEPRSSLRDLYIYTNHYGAPETLADLSHFRNAEFIIIDQVPLRDLTEVAGLQSVNKLSITNCGLTGSIMLYDMDTLRTLDLSENDIGDDFRLGGLPHLRSLILDQNKLTEFPMLYDLGSLEEISLQDNRIERLESLRHCTQVRAVHLERNRLADLSSLPAMSLLEELYLDDNAISDVTPLVRLDYLSSLTLNGNAVTSLLPIQSLVQGSLQKLHIAGNPITDYAEVLDGSPVTDLDLSEMDMDSLDFLLQLDYLEYLSLRGNQIRDLSVFAALAEKKNYLDTSRMPRDAYELEQDQLSELAMEYAGYPLVSLVLNDNLITDLAPLGGMVYLQQLYAANNLIEDLTCMKEWRDRDPRYPAIQVLDVSGNRLTDGSVLTRYDFQYANLSHNRIAGTVEADLFHTAELDLSYNQIESFHYRRARGCYSIDLSHNQIASIQHAMGSGWEESDSFDNLYEVDLSHNRLTAFPVDFLVDNRVSDMNLEGNQISDLTPVQGCQFTNLNLRDNSITDFSPLLKAEVVGRIWLSGNPADPGVVLHDERLGGAVADIP